VATSRALHHREVEDALRAIEQGRANSIAPLPIRRIDFDDPGDRESHDELVDLARRAEAAVRSARTGPSVSEQTIAGRRVD
jgi:hypothetical protein